MTRPPVKTVKVPKKDFKPKKNYKGNFYFQYDYDEYIYANGMKQTRAVMLGMNIKVGDSIVLNTKKKAVVTSSIGSCFLQARYEDKEYGYDNSMERYEPILHDDYIDCENIIALNGNTNIDQLIDNYFLENKDKKGWQV